MTDQAKGGQALRKIFNVSQRWQAGPVGRPLVRLARGLGIHRMLVAFFYRQDRLRPTVQMKNSAEFFGKTRDRIETVLSWLADPESREAYRRAIEFRQTHDLRARPPYDERNQYFAPGVLRLGDNEVFVDCGAYDGHTTLEFIRRTGGRYRRIVAFEPDPGNFRTVQRNTAGLHDVHLFQAGVWKEDAVLRFSDDGTTFARLETGGGVEVAGRSSTINVVRMDGNRECRDATFIKMDIEGAELNALKGAQEIIRSNRPKLAICIYHGDADMLDIIEWVHGVAPDYKLFVRHHACTMDETVMYATL